MWKRIVPALAILVSMLLGVSLVSGGAGLVPVATLTGTWAQDGYRVSWTADQPVCLWLDSTVLPFACAPTGDYLLTRGGVDEKYIPIPGRTLILRSPGREATRVVIPPDPFAVRIGLPIVAGNPIRSSSPQP